MEISKEQIKKIEKFVSQKLTSLIWYHTQAIRPLAKKLAGLEKADKEIVDAAILFHDIGYVKGGSNDHAQRSAEIARKFLEKEGFEQKFIEEVVYCILVHSAPWENQSNLVKTIEAKVVFDADMIQQLSEFGIIKHTLLYQETILKDFIKGIIQSRDQFFKAYNLIITQNGRKLAEEGYKYVKNFYKELL
ncbi:HD domain-containing protein [Patescibacteria group bacterium]|nr:HD domain-containing protein [Patescibacteria group bacterium]